MELVHARNSNIVSDLVHEIYNSLALGVISNGRALNGVTRINEKDRVTLKFQLVPDLIDTA